jgi:hypothetical protein
MSVVLISCGKKEDKPVTGKNQFAADTSDMKTTPADNPNEAFSLKYSYEKGKKYNYRISLTSSDKQVLKTDTTISQSIRQTAAYLIELTPVEIDPDGTMELNVLINSTKVDADANGKIYSFEYGVTKDSLEKVKFAEYEAMVKNPFSIRVSNLGDIIEIFRADRISNRFIQLKGFADSVTTEQRAGVTKNMAEQLLRPLMNQIFRKVPDHNMAKDSSWSYTQPPAQATVFKMENTNIFKVANLEKFNSDKIAVLEGYLKTVITGNNKASERGVDYNFSKPVTSAGGKIYFDVSKGHVIKSKTFTKMQTHVAMEGPGPKGRQKGERSETVENTYIMELLD